jgi:hypothetical protein
MGAKAQIQGYVMRLLSGGIGDDRDAAKTIRLKRYGEVNVSEADCNQYGYAEEGSFLIATSPTIGTGLVGVTAQVAYNATGPSVYVYNNDPIKSLYLMYLKQIASAAATSSTAHYYACVLDPTYRAITTDNFATAITPVNPNGGIGVPLTPVIKFQSSATVSVIAAASGSARTVARGQLGGLNIIGDEFIVAFGKGDHTGHPGLTGAQVAGLSKRVSNAGPVIVGPGQTFTIHQWALAQAASASPEFELAMVAR